MSATFTYKLGDKVWVRLKGSGLDRQGIVREVRLNGQYGVALRLLPKQSISCEASELEPRTAGDTF